MVTCTGDLWDSNLALENILKLQAVFALLDFFKTLAVVKLAVWAGLALNL